MSLLDSLIQMGTGTSGGSGGGILAVVQGLANDHGGLPGLLSKLSEGGLGAQVQSWIGSGANLPISADQIIQALGQGRVGQIAQQLGIDPQQAAAQLAQHLPQIVDHVTPNGQMPANDLVSAALRALASRG
jgi:uncharacterized protein YidB (DUF937 family)